MEEILAQRTYSKSSCFPVYKRPFLPIFCFKIGGLLYTGVRLSLPVMYCSVIFLPKKGSLLHGKIRNFIHLKSCISYNITQSNPYLEKHYQRTKNIFHLLKLLSWRYSGTYYWRLSLKLSAYMTRKFLPTSR